MKPHLSTKSRVLSTYLVFLRTISLSAIHYGYGSKASGKESKDFKIH